jgi:hypothetical protein
MSEKLSLTINNDTNRVEIAKEHTCWRRYDANVPDFITEVFHAPVESALLYVFRSYLAHNDDCQLLFVYEDSGSPIKTVKASCPATKQDIDMTLGFMLNQLGDELGFDL